MHCLSSSLLIKIPFLGVLVFCPSWPPIENFPSCVILNVYSTHSKRLCVLLSSQMRGSSWNQTTMFSKTPTNYLPICNQVILETKQKSSSSYESIAQLSVKRNISLLNLINQRNWKRVKPRLKCCAEPFSPPCLVFVTFCSSTVTLSAFLTLHRVYLSTPLLFELSLDC